MNEMIRKNGGLRVVFLAAALALGAAGAFGQSAGGALNRLKPVVTDRDLVIRWTLRGRGLR